MAPQLIFACCDGGMSQMQSLLTNANVIANLKSLHAGLAVGVLDLTPELAELVRRLNRDGIPVIAGLGMPADQGSYFNAENASEAAARFAAFDAWSREQGLRWNGVGLDIEPNFAELASLNGPLGGGCLPRSFGAPSTFSACTVHSECIPRSSPTSDPGATSS